MATKPTRPRRSPRDKQQRDADRAAQLQQHHDELAQAIAEMRTGEDWQNWLRVATRFHQYSFRNIVGILKQRPDATAVAGYKAWQSLGRQVQKGERGIRILAPVLKKIETESTDEAAEPREAAAAASVNRRVVGFSVIHVWDVSQTSGDPLPEHPKVELLTGQAPPGLWDGLAGIVKERGFQLGRGTDLRGGANGITDFRARTVTVRSDVDDAQAVKTLAHEVGHILLDHHEPGSCRGRGEVEAESFAYIVATHHGLNTDDYSFGYIAGWAAADVNKKPEETVVETGQRVLAAATTAIKTLDAAAEAAPAAEDLTARAEIATERTAAVAYRATALGDRAQFRPADQTSSSELHPAALAGEGFAAPLNLTNAETAPVEENQTALRAMTARAEPKRAL